MSLIQVASTLLRPTQRPRDCLCRWLCVTHETALQSGWARQAASHSSKLLALSISGAMLHELPLNNMCDGMAL